MRDKKEMERRADEDQHLTKALPKIEMAHHLLMAVDHEIKDYQQEKHDLRRSPMPRRSRRKSN